MIPVCDCKFFHFGVCWLDLLLFNSTILVTLLLVVLVLYCSFQLSYLIRCRFHLSHTCIYFSGLLVKYEFNISKCSF
jgi:hypothetical protein